MEDKPIIVIASYPRSGNTFVRQILLEAFNCKSMTTYPDEHITSHLGDYLPHAKFDQPVSFVKTHSEKHDVHPVWHIVRDGRDAVSSYRHMASGSKLNIDDWQNCVMKIDQHATVTTRYEDLIANPIGEVDKALVAFGVADLLPLKNTVLTSFEELHERSPSFWRKGRVGSWRDEMNDAEEFEAANSLALQHFGYEGAIA